MMKTTPAILVLSLAFLVFACGKNKFETTPRIEIKSYSSKIIPVNGQLTLRLTYFDKEGDLSGGDFWLARYRLNRFPLPPAQDKADTLDAAHGYALPDFPPRAKGEISLDFDYQGFLKESATENDTIYFRIAVSDKEGHKSDTISTDPIVILL